MSGSLFDDPAFGDSVAGQNPITGIAETNGHDPDADAPPPERPFGDDEHHAEEAKDEPTTWEPIDLGPYLRGEVERPQPSVGIVRTDGLRLLYPGREHAVVGATESGKTWFSLASTAAEMAAGHRVLYVHFEEPDPGSTIERLLLLGSTPDDILKRLRFIAPTRAVRSGWMDSLLSGRPALVVLDGINEGMAVHASGMDTDGWSAFRRCVITPCIKAGATVLSCDHIPMGADGARINAYGTVHKGNTLDGARIQLENTNTFGRGMRGVSHVFVTKDRPGHLRVHGKSTKVPGKTYVGTLVADDSDPFTPFGLRFHEPKAEDKDAPGADPAAELAEEIHEVIADLPKHAVESVKKLKAHLRAAGVSFRNEGLLDALDDLVVAGRLVEVFGKRGAKGYQAVSTCPQASTEQVSDDMSRDLSPRPVPLKDRVAGDRSHTEVSPSSGIGGDRSGQVGEESAADSEPALLESDENHESHTTQPGGHAIKDEFAEGES